MRGHLGRRRECDDLHRFVFLEVEAPGMGTASVTCDGHLVHQIWLADLEPVAVDPRTVEGMRAAVTRLGQTRVTELRMTPTFVGLRGTEWDVALSARERDGRSVGRFLGHAVTATGMESFDPSTVDLAKIQRCMPAEGQSWRLRVRPVRGKLEYLWEDVEVQDPSCA